jgi:hypothetical protein
MALHTRTAAAIGVGVVGLLAAAVCVASAPAATPEFKAPFSWTLSAPLIAPRDLAGEQGFAVKDPTVVFFEGRWHVFMTVRYATPPVRTEYLSFDTWENADQAPRHTLKWHDRYFCAPQVFYFRPHKKWYVVYQVAQPDRKLKLQPAYATSDKIGDPASWSPGHLFFPDADPQGVSRWIDFWVVCDDKRAYLFFTSNDGNMWRMWTPIEKFPEGFDHRELALKGDIFEASHTYRLLGQDKYLTVIEAIGKEPQSKDRRYYQAYTADRLDGVWQPLAASEDKPFAGAANVRQPQPPWADNISHGELIRAGCDETMTVDPAHLEFLIQGVNNSAKGDKGYGGIPWRLGLLKLVSDAGK